MIDVIYIEDEIADHPRTEKICRQFPDATRIPVDYYGEVFNKRSQNFRLQKQNPALILAKKFKNHVLAAPDDYGVGGDQNYYFSHMLNCLYDCRYCFLQGMYRSANYVLFVNYEDFDHAILETVEKTTAKQPWFYSGYDCDSLALEPVTGFVEHCLRLFRHLPGTWLELRTKSTQIRSLLATQPLDNCVVAFSLSPESVVKSLESKTPTLMRRIEAMQRLQQHGWKVGLRFDPLIYQQGYQQIYAGLFEQVFSRLEPQLIHSVSLGSFRMPEPFFKNIVRLYPDEALFAGPLEKRQNMVSYREDLESGMKEDCAGLLLKYIPDNIYYPCNLGFN